ncbi:MAG: NAD(P)/FAD-dependent oxidoreductase, partial [Promethearchaeota archaeon]
GLKVCLIDRKERSKIGDKICGDAVGSEIFDMLNINPPRDEELSCLIKGAKLYTPNLKKSLTLIDPKQVGYVVNRLEFGQRLLNEALDTGINQLLDGTTALDLIYKDNSVSGVKVKLKNGEKMDLSAKIVIDASGFYSPLRKQAKNPLIEKEISKEDAILCFREIVRFQSKDQEVKDPEFISIFLDQEKAPGGYIWYFPKNKTSVNIGLGVYMDYKGKVKDFYQKHVFNNFIETDKCEILSSGGGVAPVRRPLWSCADNGLLLVGDAACHVNPLHGGGIDPSMRAGFYAANTALAALEDDNFSLHKLWEYNQKIMTSFGAEFASLDLLRIVLQKLTNQSLNFGLEKELLSGEEILQIAEKGNLNLSLLSIATKAIKGFSNPKLLLDLNYLRIKMNEINKHYRDFPGDIENFETWKLKTLQIYENVKKMTYG